MIAKGASKSVRQVNSSRKAHRLTTAGHNVNKEAMTQSQLEEEGKCKDHGGGGEGRGGGEGPVYKMAVAVNCIAITTAIW